MIDPKGVICLTDYDMPWRENAGEVSSQDAEVVRLNSPLFEYEDLRCLQGGQLRRFRNTKIPLRGFHGNVIGVLASYEDIPPYKDIELALRLRSRPLDAIVNGFSSLAQAPHATRDRDQSAIGKIRLASGKVREVTTIRCNYPDGAIFWRSQSSSSSRARPWPPGGFYDRKPRYT